MVKKPMLNKLLPSDGKARALVVLGLMLMLFIGGYFYMTRKGTDAIGDSGLSAVPSDVQNIPGSQLTPAYTKALLRANVENAKQAEFSGESSVATLINENQLGMGGTCSPGTCCSCDKVDVRAAIKRLVATNKISSETAGTLLALDANNVPVSEHELTLAGLVKDGKLTPEQARQLSADYKKNDANKMAEAGAKAMDTLISSGQLPIAAANSLLALQKKNASVSDYAAELAELVREGKISPETARKLLEQYKAEHGKRAAQEAKSQLAHLLKTQKITEADAETLQNMQAQDVPVANYAAELSRLSQSGKISPDVERSLLAQYKAMHPEALDNAKKVLASIDQKGQAQLAAFVAQGQLSSDAASALAALQNKKLSKETYAAELDRLVKEGKLSPEMRDKLLAQYQALHAERQKAANTIASASLADLPGTALTLSSTDGGGAGFSQLQRRMVVAQAQQQQVGAPQATGAQSQILQRQEQAYLAMQAAMKTQSQQIFKSWNAVAPQQNILGIPEVTPGASNGSRSSTLQAKADASAPLIRSGDIVYAVLDTAINSDYPDQVVMATVVEGPLKGARLLGKIRTGVHDGQKVMLNFNLLSVPDWPRSQSITAVAIDPDTARQAMASSVNNHYLLRYGTLFATSFLSGYADSLSQAGTASISTSGESVSVTRANVSPAGRIMVGLGEVGKNSSDAAKKLFDKPPTVRLASGIGLGILFMQDVAKPTLNLDKKSEKQEVKSSAAASKPVQVTQTDKQQTNKTTVAAISAEQLK